MKLILTDTTTINVVSNSATTHPITTLVRIHPGVQASIIGCVCLFFFKVNKHN